MGNQEAVLQGYFDVLLVGALDWSVAREASAPDAARLLAAQSAEADVRAHAKATDGVAAAASPAAIQQTREPYLHLQPFTVVGLKLAIDRTMVEAVLPFPAETDGEPDELRGTLGSITFEGRCCAVLDTAAAVVPANHPRRAAMLARRRYHHLLVIRGVAVALACETLDEDILLPRASVRWKGEAGGYPWLAGTLPAFGYALLDPARLRLPEG
jgi:hypothetical protein